MTKKTWIAGLLAAIVMFIWGFIAHDVLPTAEMALKTTLTEEAVMASIKGNMSGSGMYIIPGKDMTEAKKLSGDAQKAAMKAGQDKWFAGPTAIVVYNDHPGPGFGMLLGAEFLSTLVAALIIAFAFSMALPNLNTFGKRVLFVTLIGLLPLFVVDMSLWNWYRFPDGYAITEVLDYGIGGLLAGIFLAWFYRKEGATQPTMGKAA
jgi:hypothetical protein